MPSAVFFCEVFVLTVLQGASAGQRILKIRVVDVNSHSRVTVGRVFVRTLLICLVVPALFEKDGRGYQDWFSNSVMIKV